VVTYEISHYPDSHLVIRAEGQSTLSVGDFSKIPEAEKEKLRKALFDEVKLDIATIREKEVKVS
jgi:hypothetical protein